MEIALIKKHLDALATDNKKSFLILTDMTGPIAHANGHTIESRTRQIEEGWDEKRVAEAIFNDADWIAFYQIVDGNRLRAAMGMLWEIGLAPPPKPLDLKLIKQHLQSREFGDKACVVLSDMTGPVGLANGHPITAVSRAMPRAWNELRVAEELYQQAEWIAFYENMDVPTHSHTHIRAAFGKLSEIGL